MFHRAVFAALSFVDEGTLERVYLSDADAALALHLSVLPKLISRGVAAGDQLGKK
jgi:hypothetical protein